MIAKKIETNEGRYIATVNSYTYEGFKCKLYKFYWMFPVKVHEEIFLRELFNDAKEMIYSTISRYERGKLRV